MKTTIFICDATDAEFNKMVEYCEESKLSLLKFSNMDVSDVSGQWDTIAEFQFQDTQDAMIFKLKFQN